MEKQNKLNTLIDRNIIKKETVITLIYMKKYIDSMSFVPVEDDFIVDSIDGYKINATCVTDGFQIIVNVNDITYIDGMHLERLSEAYGI